VKENVTMGRLIPAGTASSGIGTCGSRRTACLAAAAKQRRRKPPPTEEHLDLDREIVYAFTVEEPMAGRAPTGEVESP
jgi:hypothetical protein